MKLQKFLAWMIFSIWNSLLVIDGIAQNIQLASFGPPGQVTALAMSPHQPSTFFVGSHFSGVFKSINTGASWEHSAQGLPSNEFWGTGIGIIKFDPINAEIIYIGTGFNDTGFGTGLYKSIDGGKAWKRILDGMTIYAISINPQNPKEIFITNNAQLLRTLDAGVTWQEVLRFSDSGAPTGGPHVFDQKNSKIVYTVDWNNFYKSVDSGNTWTKTRLNQQIVSPIRMFQDQANGEFYICGHNDVFKFVPGQGLSELNNGLPIGFYDKYRDMVYDKETNTFYLAAMNDGLYKSSDNGKKWEKIFAAPNVMAVSANKNTLVVGTAAGVYKSVDTGKNWQSASKNLGTALINYLTVSETDHRFLYTATTNGLFQSRDGGLNWVYLSQIGGGHFVDQVAFDPIDPNIAYAAFGYFFDNFYGIFKTTDGGQTWADIAPLPDMPITAVAVQHNDPRIIYIGSPSFVGKSDDGGKSWESSWLLIEPTEVYSIQIARSNPKVVYFGLTSNDPQLSGVWVSEDAGINWEKRINGLGNGFSSPSVFSIAIHPFNAGIAYAGIGMVGIFKTMNLGKNWSFLSGAWPQKDPNITGIAIHEKNPNILFAVVTSNYLAPAERGIYKSLNGGGVWMRLPESNLSNTIMTSLKHKVVNGQEVFYAGTYGGGVFTNAHLVTAVVESQLDIPSTITLRDNYPNPFNASTMIEYKLPQAAKVILKIYNSAGQEVRTLVNVAQSVGWQSVRWDGRDDLRQPLSSGIYLYKLQVGKNRAAE
jgi:photosystem II stability/assembly factor-like uncharacterized protein